jgi:hypothetical protein
MKHSAISIDMLYVTLPDDVTFHLNPDGNDSTVPVLHIEDAEDLGITVSLPSREKLIELHDRINDFLEETS